MAPRANVNFNDFMKNLNKIPSPSDLSPREGYPNDELEQFTNIEFQNHEDPSQNGSRVHDGVDLMDGYGSIHGVSGIELYDMNSLGAEAYGSEDVNFGYAPQIDPALGMNLPYNHDFNLGTSGSNEHNVSNGLSHASQGSISSPIVSRTNDSAASPETAARLAAEEDKRRRNTAASARFRDKKKQREKQMEQTNAKLAETVSAQETRIKTLEAENKWLKELIQGMGPAKLQSELSKARQ